jgi:hypothetical protein
VVALVDLRPSLRCRSHRAPRVSPPFFGNFDQKYTFVVVPEKNSGEFILEPKETS